MSDHRVYGYIFTAATLVQYARRNGLDKQFPNSNDLISDLVKASIDDIISKADAIRYARLSVADEGSEWYHCLALYSNMPEKDRFNHKPTKDVVTRLMAVTGIREVPKWYKCPL